MASKQTKPSAIDPELERQLQSVGADDEVGVTFTLRTPDGSPYLTAEQTEQTVQRLMQAAAGKSAAGAARVKVFPNIQSFAVFATAALVRRLLARAEIASATANEQPEDLLIRPVKPRGQRGKG